MQKKQNHFKMEDIYQYVTKEMMPFSWKPHKVFIIDENKLPMVFANIKNHPQFYKERKLALNWAKHTINVFTWLLENCHINKRIRYELSIVFKALTFIHKNNGRNFNYNRNEDYHILSHISLSNTLWWITPKYLSRVTPRGYQVLTQQLKCIVQMTCDAIQDKMPIAPVELMTAEDFYQEPISQFRYAIPYNCKCLNCIDKWYSKRYIQHDIYECLITQQTKIMSFDNCENVWNEKSGMMYP